MENFTSSSQTHPSASCFHAAAHASLFMNGRIHFRKNRKAREETTSSQDKAPKSPSLIISILSITLERPHHKTDDQSVRLQGMTRGDKGRSIVQYVTQPIGEFAFEL